jgi:hypothetical protein
MRPTDFCHPNEIRALAPRVFPARSRHFRGGEAPRSLGLRTARPGDRTFHDVRTRFGGSPVTRFPVMSTSRPPSRAWACCSHGADCDRASGTPVALLVHPHASHAFAWAASSPCRWLLAAVHGSESAAERRDHPWTPRVTENVSTMIRDAFNRQEALRGIRWPLRPRSRDHSTAFGDDMTAGWHSRATLGPAPILPPRTRGSSTRDGPFTRCPCRRFDPPTFAPS